MDRKRLLGMDGVSVTSPIEPPGTNCANGGSKFTAGTLMTYACNGAGGGGGSLDALDGSPCNDGPVSMTALGSSPR
jgi:hypothetical protein